MNWKIKAKADRKIEVGDILYLPNIGHDAISPKLKMEVVFVGMNGSRATLLNHNKCLKYELSNFGDNMIEVTSTGQLLIEHAKFSCNFEEITIKNGVLYAPGVDFRDMKVGDRVKHRVSDQYHEVKYIGKDDSVITDRDGKTIFYTKSEFAAMFMEHVRYVGMESK